MQITHNSFFYCSGNIDYNESIIEISLYNLTEGSEINISIPIFEDIYIESIESFFGKLYSGVVGERIFVNPNTTEVFIIDNDGKYTF